MPNYLVELDDGIWLYRQPGACLEIGKRGDDGNDDDIVHIHSEQVAVFIKALNMFVTDSNKGA